MPAIALLAIGGAGKPDGVGFWHLAVVSGREQRFRVWTYDGEFRTIWRWPDGTRIPLALG